MNSLVEYQGTFGAGPLKAAAELGLRSVFSSLCYPGPVAASVQEWGLFDKKTLEWLNNPCVESLLDGFDPNTRINGDRAVNFALNWGNASLAVTLICFGGRPDALDCEGVPPLATAVGLGSIAVTQLLIWLGCTPIFCGPRLVKGYPMLRLKSNRNGLDLLEILLREGGDVNQTSQSQETPLTIASGRGDVPMIRALVAKGANLNASSSSGWTALHWATMGNHLEAVRCLIELGANIEHRDGNGLSILDTAMRNHFFELSSVLRKAGLKDRYSEEPEWRNATKPIVYEFFVSYRHRLFSRAAQSLVDELRAKGCSVFLDRDAPELSQYGDDSRIPEQVLRKVLYFAAKSAYCTLFFEGKLVREVDPRTAESSDAFNWQLFEQLHSHRWVPICSALGPEQIDDFVAYVKSRPRAIDD